ncbi:ankyrin repeat and SOCS box protein 3-like [Uloborus diversus]|uniref:ankyrin repeat and SOCS box protein 3-like n=1 Tax=Uloborus diversus TaxID=327109 RepID=UPI002409A687|nr:ankyrin repeat and SOCS box protein 3-like [Uloborus diversus]XP_054711671.1 ankyrin repeat and SOCS box protein 3-like [Uloborus diversus]
MDFTEQWSDTCSRVGHAARIGNRDSLLKLINLEKPVDVSDNRGWKPLHEAAALGPSLECLEALLKHKDTNINWKTHEGETALLLACKRRRGTDASGVVSMLLKYGADPNIVDNEEESPLLAALRNDSREVVELLLDADANVNATDCSMWSPLHEAANRKDANLVCSLLSHGAQIDVQDECGMTPIFTAAQYGRENCLRELLKAAKEKGQEDVVNIGAEDWATPLMIAAQQGFADCVALLTEYGANPDLKTSDHATALHMAVQGNHKLCLDILLSKMDVNALISYFHPSTPRTWVHSDMICPLHLAVEWER